VVPVVDLTRRGRAHADTFAAVARRVAESGSVLLGDETAAFEAEFATWLDARHVVAVSSGASALQLALAGLGIGQGDEVIVPAFTAVPTAAAVCALGATPVFVDVDAETAGIDSAAVDAARTSRTRAVIVVHLYGRQVSIPDIDIPVVEDAAQAHGAISDHARSAAVIYSFYPTKNLGGIGDGGAVVTSNAALADAVRRRRVHGLTHDYLHEEISQNFRISELEAGWLRICLPDVRAGNARRREIAEHYRRQAPGLVWHAPSTAHVYHLAVARVAGRDQFRSILADLGVATATHYPKALTQQPAYRRYVRDRCPESEQWAAECVSLPCFPELTDDEIEHVGQALAKVTS